MTVRTIARDSWRDELDSFSRQHEGWIVSVRTRGPNGEVAIAAHDVPLQSVSAVTPGSDDIAIIVGSSHSHLTHEVHDPAALQVDLTANEAERALIICSNDGTTTTIEFRSPVRPEYVDGLPTRGHH
jgi:uncharacterized protein DUF5335